ncbi:MAG TPA: hypothetical protein VFX98_19855 [Longimicrobiaceae bacterium]|nr:hypothetical protein [Longimicrobiaceae bacterium]
MPNRACRRLLCAALLLPALAACDDPTGGEGGIARAVVVLNSVDNTLTLAPVEGTAAGAGEVRTVSLGPTGTPVRLATRGSIAVVPMGNYPFAQVVDIAAGQVVHTVPLPANSGATGVAFLNDSIAVVGNPNLNTVTPVNVRRGTTGAQVAVGDYPHLIVARGNRVYVLNAELDDAFQPARPGTVHVLNAQLQPVDTITLGGLNPGAAAFDEDGETLYVLNSGTFGGDNSSLSVIDVSDGDEERVVNGFGNFPGALDVAPNGDVYVGVYDVGIVVWDPGTLVFDRPLANPIVPGGAPPVSALAFDRDGKLHTTNPGTCQNPGTAYRLSQTFAVERTIATGVCPFFVAFAEVED